MIIFPYISKVPKGVDARVVEILKSYLPKLQELKTAFDEYEKKCISGPRRCMPGRCRLAHSIELGLGFRGSASSFGKLYFVCQSDHRRKEMSLQIPVEGVALAAHRAKRLQPPAIPGMAQLGNIKRAWTDRAPEGYKRLLDTTRKRLQAFDESLGIEPFAFSGDEESASADESEGDPTSTPFPYSPSKSDAFYRSPSKKAVKKKDDTPSPPKKAYSVMKRPQPKPRPAYKQYKAGTTPFGLSSFKLATKPSEGLTSAVHSVAAGAAGAAGSSKTGAKSSPITSSRPAVKPAPFLSSPSAGSSKGARKTSVTSFIECLEADLSDSIIEVTSTDDDSPSIAPAKRRATCDIKGKGKASSNASPAKSRAKRLRKSDEDEKYSSDGDEDRVAAKRLKKL
ncbi:hypothetical protein ACEPAG_2149 [Sanghuangporus baumii]